MVYEVDFLPADKHESFLQVDSMALGVGSQASSRVSRATNLQYLCNISRKT